MKANERQKWRKEGEGQEKSGNQWQRGLAMSEVVTKKTGEPQENRLKQ